MKRRFLLYFVSLVAIGSAAVIFMGMAIYYNPTFVAGAYASHVFGRSVTIGNAKINLHPLTFEFEDFRVANAPWAKQPEMLRVARISAEPDVESLLRFRPKFRHLSVTGAMLLLERDEDGTGNWRQAGAHHTQTAEEAVQSRKYFPGVLDLEVKDSSIFLHTSGGNELKVDFAHLHLATTDEYHPVTLEVDGAYNAIPVRMKINTGSYESLRDVSKPLAVDIAAEGAGLTLTTKLQMMDPLNFDRFSGSIAAQVKKAGEAAGLVGGAFQWNKELAFESAFERGGDLWALTHVKGTLAENAFTADKIEFIEGKRKEPDDLHAKIDFAKIEVSRLLPPSSRNSEKKQMHLEVSDNPPVLLDLTLTAKELAYKSLKALNVSLHTHIAAGVKSLDNVTMDIFGSQLRASLSAKHEEHGNLLTVRGELPRADMLEILHAFGIESETISGRAKIALSVQARGESEIEWRRSLDGNAEFSMENGKMSRKFIHAASEDIRTLFQSDKTIEMPCMIAALEVHNGIGTLSPFTVRTSEGNLFGAGTVSLPQEIFDLTFQTDAKTTSGLALDVPVHMGGTFDNPAFSLGTSSKAHLTNDATCR